MKIILNLRKIACSNTIINPYAVVIKFKAASFLKLTMYFTIYKLVAFIAMFTTF